MLVDVLPSGKSVFSLFYVLLIQLVCVHCTYSSVTPKTVQNSNLFSCE